MSLQFGCSAWPLATVVTIFIAGQGLGARLAGGISDRVKNPIRFFAGIEAVTAILGLLAWPLLKSFSAFLVPFYGLPYIFPLLRGACLLIFLFPTMLMGAAPAILATADLEHGPFAKTVGFFYGLDVLGAATAVLAAGFVFMPIIGVHLTLALSAFLEFGVAGAALFVADRGPVVSTERPIPFIAVSRRKLCSVLLLAMLCGFCASSLEMAWTRLLLPVLGPSSYSLCVILFSYLSGMGLSGLVIAKYLPRNDRSLPFSGRLLGRVCAWSSVGAIAGYFLMGFVFLPKIGVSGAVMRTSGSNGDLLFLKDGVSSTVAVYRTPDETTLKIDGKTAVSTGADRTTSLLLGYLPMMLHPNPKRVCVIGYDSGAAVRAVVAYAPRSVDVVELEPAVITASPYFRSVNESVLDDPGVHLHLDDGRTFLSYGKTLFDVIVSNPPTPWVAGAGRLFSHEFYEQAKCRLANDGVFCQWFPTRELSRPTLNVMIQTLAQTFPNFSVFVVGSDFICVASNAPLSSTFAELAKRMSAPEVKRSLADIGIQNPFDLLIGYYQSFPDDKHRYPTMVHNTDDNEWLECHAPWDKFAGRLPQLDLPSVSLVFDRYALRFFPDISRDQIALGLAASIARLRPLASFRIADMAPLFEKTATLTRLKICSRCIGAGVGASVRRHHDGRCWPKTTARSY